MQKLIALLRKVDDNLMKILLVGFIFLIPLYPKFPLIGLNYTYIAVRVEDFYMALMCVVYLIQLLRRKVNLDRRFILLFCLFWIAIFASFISGAFIQKVIPHQLYQVAFLNAARRFEYMIVFFMAISAIRSRSDFFFYLRMVYVVFGIVVVYGIGQKFLGFPAVQTMNPEYAKGYLLFLTPEARVSSTFAGHYDLAAYLILVMPIILGSYFVSYSKWLFLIFNLGLYTLVLTAGRAAYGAYIVSTGPFLLLMKKYKYLIYVIIVTLVLTYLTSNLVTRIKRTFVTSTVFVNKNTGAAIIPREIGSLELPPGDVRFNNRQNTGATVDPKVALAQLPEAKQKEVMMQILTEIRLDASKSGRILTKQEETSLVAAKLSELSVVTSTVTDISFATRLQVEWPRAIKAFITNPFLGTGPSSITEATDGDYFRWLGEFGLLGTSLFLLILGKIAWVIFSALKKLKDNLKVLYWGFLFGMIGLMMNATLLDVFEASKVAFTFWMIAGLFIGSTQYLAGNKNEVSKPANHKK